MSSKEYPRGTSIFISHFLVVETIQEKFGILEGHKSDAALRRGAPSFNDISSNNPLELELHPKNLTILQDL